MIDGRKRGVLFDVGHGGASFRYSHGGAADEGRLRPGLDLDRPAHGSMNAAMKDMLNVMGKFLAMGMSLDDVILRSTWNPAKEIQLEELGQPLGRLAGATSRCCGSRRDGSASSIPSADASTSSQRLSCEMTLRNGKVVYDLNGMTADRWDTLPPARAAAIRGGTTFAAEGSEISVESYRSDPLGSRTQ